MPTLGPVGAEEIEDDLEALLDGVASIGAPGVPGPLCVYGSEAFPVIVGRIRDYGSRAFPVSSIMHAPVVAAGRWQAGRIVALGHDGYFTRATLKSLDTGRLIVNALRWAAGGEPSGPRIGVVGAADLHAWLKEGGHDVVEASLTPNSLRTVDVVAVVMWNQSMPEIEALSAFVRDGGGLVTAVTGWGWAQLHPDLDLNNDYAGNRLLTPVGIRWADAWLARTSTGSYAVDGPSPELTHTGTALDAVESHVAGRRTLTDSEIDQALDSLVLTSNCLPLDDALLAPRLHELVGSDERNRRWPSAEQPVGKADVVARLASVLFVLEQNRTPPEYARAHPRAADFPGPVPDNAPRITRSLTINTTIPRWHSTGLYAVPGELVTGHGARQGSKSQRLPCARGRAQRPRMAPVRVEAHARSQSPLPHLHGQDSRRECFRRPDLRRGSGRRRARERHYRDQGCCGGAPVRVRRDRPGRVARRDPPCARSLGGDRRAEHDRHDGRSRGARPRRPGRRG